MEFLTQFVTVALIHLLAVISPGPDFAMTVKNSIVYSRKTGIYTAVGLGLGILVHVTYSLVGVGLIIAQSILIFSIIKFIGAGYLIYIGLKCLKSQKKSPAEISEQKREDITGASAIKTGFLTNALNPKATLFFLSLFTVVINPETPIIYQIIYGIEMACMTFFWFSGVAMILSHSKVQGKFIKIQHWFERCMGAALIALGIKLALTSKNNS